MVGGSLYKKTIDKCMEKLRQCEVDMISAKDIWSKRECDKKDWKYKEMKRMISRYFGKKLNGKHDIKIID